MSRQFEVPADDYAEFRATVKRLVKEGKLDLAKDKTLRRPEQAGMIVGLFRRSAKGFGFVRPHTSTSKTDQIYIPVEATRDASSGDEVAVKITKRSRREGMNVEGRIVEVLARASGIFVGTYFEAGDTSFVKIDGTTFREPISVGDPGAKGAKPGDKVALEIVRYPTPYLEGEGVITEILGQRGQPGVDTLTVIRAFNIPDTFDEEVLDEAREQAKLFNEAEIGTRLDLRALADGHDRPGDRSRLRRRHLAVARSNGPLDAGGPHRRRVALRSARIGARPRRPGIAARASICPIASSPCFPRSSPTAWPASRPAARGTPSARSWISLPTGS